MTSKPRFGHSERILQWIWDHHLFDSSRLYTTCGKKVEIIHAGNLNKTDGPDFKQAAFHIGGMEWYGDVEIHISSGAWNEHGHHADPNFNSVVLHVVAESNPSPVYCENESLPYTLNLLPCIKPELHRFLRHSKPAELPCSSDVSFISEEIFHKQIEKAHREYFDRKSNDFLKFYDPELPPARAWKQAFVISIFDGSGIPYNREPMQQLAKDLLADFPKEPEKGFQQALETAGLNQKTSPYNWNLKSMRPASHPRNRIPEAVRMASQVINTSPGDFLKPDAVHLWESMLSSAKIKNTRHYKILYGTVFLPSLYVLGNLFAASALSEKVYHAWTSLKSPVPKSLLAPFRSLNVPASLYAQKLGAIHQLRNYCRTGHCDECFVLKSAIHP